jgi:uncharacterized repeat protein (TIGR01451 family)
VRFALLISLIVVVVGFVWVMTIGTMLGALLVVGGVGALGVLVLPELFDRFTVFLSTGSFRRWH